MKKNPLSIPPNRVAAVLTGNVRGLTNSDQEKWIGTGTSKPKERKMGPGTFPVEKRVRGFGKSNR